MERVKPLCLVLIIIMGGLFMAIHDVDKSNNDRGAPMPASHDEQGLARMAAGTNSTNYVTDATTGISLTNTLGYFRIVGSGTVTLVATHNTDSEVTISHNLSYVPGIIAYVANGSSYIPLPYMLAGVDVVNHNVRITEFVAVSVINSTSVQFIAQNSDTVTDFTYTIRYYLIHETAN